MTSKYRFKEDLTEQGNVLIIESTKGDELVYVDASRLQRGDLALFLPFAYAKWKRAYTFTYRCDACVGLSEFLRYPIAPGQLGGMIGSLLRLVHMCEDEGLSRVRVVLDIDHVYFDVAQNSLRFAYVPTRGYSSPFGVAALLTQICERAIVPETDRALASVVLDYARRTSVLTSIEFEDFLAQLGLHVSRHARAAKKRRGDPAYLPSADKDQGWDFVSRAERRQDWAEPSIAPTSELDVRSRTDEREESGEAIREPHGDGEAPAPSPLPGSSAVAAAGAPSPSVRSSQDSEEYAATPSPIHDTEPLGFSSLSHDDTLVSAERADSAPVPAFRTDSTIVLGAAQHRPAYMLKRLSSGSCYGLNEGVQTLGRSHECDLSLPGVKSLSRRHAEITVRDGKCFLRDLQSTNGVTVDGRRLEPGASVSVEPGCRIVFGADEFELLDG